MLEAIAVSGGTALLAAIAACAGGITILLFRASPKLAFVIWTLVLFFVPLWIGATVGFFWSAITAVTLVALLSNLADIRLTPVDAVMAAFVVIVLALFAMRAASLSATVIALLEWVLPYAWGRIVLAKVTRSFVTQVIAVIATVTAVLALIEFATGTNFFTSLPALSPTLYDEWGPLQERAGMLRAEGAFGHSIALGAALAMSSVFVLAARWSVLLRLLALGAIAGATVATFSRIGLITLALSIVLALVLLPGISARMRGWVVAVGAVVTLAVLPVVGAVFLEAGDEASGSADYRSGLFALVSQVQLLGGAGDWTGLTVGGDYLGAYANSVDNAFLVFALRFGWIPSIALVLALAMSAGLVLTRGRENPAAIAVAAQLPTLFVVALITQFGMYLWFLAGLAVSWNTVRRPEPDPLLPGIPEERKRSYSLARP